MYKFKLQTFPCPLQRWCLTKRAFRNKKALRQHLMSSHRNQRLPFYDAVIRVQSVPAVQNRSTQPNTSIVDNHSEMDYDYGDSYIQAQDHGLPEEPEIISVQPPTSPSDQDNIWKTKDNQEGSNTRSITVALKHKHIEKVGGSLWSEPARTASGFKPVDIPDIDLMLAEFALDHNISNANYSR